MARGGARAGAGRPAGAATKRTSEIANKAAADGLTPLEYMLQILRDEEQPHDERFKAAVSAAPYIHPRLASTELKGELTVNDVSPDPEKTETEWLAQHGHA